MHNLSIRDVFGFAILTPDTRNLFSKEE